MRRTESGPLPPSENDRLYERATSRPAYLTYRRRSELANDGEWRNTSDLASRVCLYCAVRWALAPDRYGKPQKTPGPLNRFLPNEKLKSSLDLSSERNKHRISTGRQFFLEESNVAGEHRAGWDWLSGSPASLPGRWRRRFRLFERHGECDVGGSPSGVQERQDFGEANPIPIEHRHDPAPQRSGSHSPPSAEKTPSRPHQVPIGPH